MKCPLFILTDLRTQMGEETGIGDCSEEGCAWWINLKRDCAIKALAIHLQIIAEAVSK